MGREREESGGEGRERKNVDKNVEKLEALCTVDGNVKWYNSYREEYGSSSTN